MAGAVVTLSLIFYWLVMLPHLTTKKARKCGLVVFPRRIDGFKDQPAASATLTLTRALKSGQLIIGAQKITVEGMF